MKKILSLATIGLAFAAVAAPQKLAVVTFNDRAAILSQAAKLGELTGVPMIGLGAVGLLAANPLAADFGAPRDGAVTTLSIYGDLETLKSPEDTDAFMKTVHYAVAYPCATVKTTNGTWAAVATIDKVPGVEGAWVVVGDDREVVSLERAAVSASGLPVLKQGEVASFSFTKSVMATLCTLMETLSAELPEASKQLKVCADLFRQVCGVSCAFRVTEKGVDVLYDLDAVSGSQLDKMGLTRLAAADPLAFAGKESLFATARAVNCGPAGDLEQWERFVALFKKYGLNLDFLTWQVEGAVMRFVIDPKALVAFVMNGEAERWGAALVQNEAFGRDLEALVTNPSEIVASGPESAYTLSVKGETLATTPSTRFATALPEVKGKPVYSVAVFNIYALFRKAADAMLKALPPECGAEPERLDMARAFLQKLPDACEGCTAMASWREGAAHRIIVRLTAEEVKGLSAVVKLIYQVTQGLQCPQGAGGGVFGEELSVDEEDED